MQDWQSQKILESPKPVHDPYNTTHTVGEHSFIHEAS